MTALCSTFYDILAKSTAAMCSDHMRMSKLNFSIKLYQQLRYIVMYNFYNA